jgi:type I restriction enzyme, S subunit
LTLRRTQQQKLAQAETLFTSFDRFVLDSLGLSLPTSDGHRTTYAVRARDVLAAKKLYPDYFHPERINAIRAVESRYTGDRATTLLGIADFVRDQRIVELGDDYLGLANVQPNTGERIESNEEDGKGNCFRYAEGDVLFARLRPYLNKVYRAEAGGVCSTEFHVIRLRRDKKGRPLRIPDYLAAVMRSSLVLAQTRHMMTGNTHPRLANEDVVNLVVPVPNTKVQEKIAAEAARRRDEARRLRVEARTNWDDAKRCFEEELLGPRTSEEEPKTDRAKGGRKQ